MPQDILKPQDESDVAADREVKPIKGSSGSSSPPPQGGQASPVMEQPQEVSPPMPTQQVVGQGLFGDINPVHPSRFIELDSAKLGTMSDPSEQMRNQVSNMVGLTDPAVLGSKLNAQANYQQLDLGLDREAVWDRVNKQYDAAKTEYDRFVTAPVFGQPAENQRVLPDGSLLNKLPPLDMSGSTEGLKSELAKTLQDVVDPDGKYNTQRTVMSFLFGDAWNLLRKGEALISNRLWNMNRVGWSKEYNQAYNQMVDEEFSKTLTRLSTPSEKFNVFNSTTNEAIGDYGEAGIVSALFYAANAIPSTLVGGIYDVSDEVIRWKTGKDPYEGSRAVDALLKARDWTLASRWSEEKYYGIQEPEDLKVGDRTGNWWWDAPENVAEWTGIDPKLAHWLIQAPVAIASDVVGDWGIDNLMMSGIESAGNKARVVITGNTLRNEVVEAVLEGQSNEVAEGFLKQVDNVPDAPTVVNVPPSARTLDDEVDVLKDIEESREQLKRQLQRQTSEVVSIDGERSALITSLDAENVYGTQVRPVREVVPADATVARPEELVLYADPVKAIIYDTGDVRPSTVTELVQRNNGQLTVVAQNLSVNGQGVIPHNFSGVLTDNELAALRRKFPNELAKYGIDIDLTKLQADFVMLDDGTVIPKPRLMLSPADKIDMLPMPDDLVAEYNRVQDDILKQRNRLLEGVESGSITPKKAEQVLDNITGLEAEAKFNVSQIVDRGNGYEIIYEELPRELQSGTDNAYELGNQLVQHQLNIDDQSTTIVLLKAQTDNLAEASKEAQDHLDQLGGVHRQPLRDSEFTQDWSGGTKQGLDQSSGGGTLVPYQAEVDPRSLDDIYEPQKLANKSSLPDQSLNKNRGIKKGDVYIGDTAKGDPVALSPDGSIHFVKTNMMGKQSYAAFVPKSKQEAEWLEKVNSLTEKVTEDTEYFLEGEVYPNLPVISENVEELATGGRNVQQEVTTKPVAVEVSENVWLHGTKTSKTLESVDVVNGGAPNELGKGVYLTQDVKVANAAARRITPVNRPSVPDATFSSENARIIRVDIEAINKGGNILDLSTPVGANSFSKGRSIRGRLYQVFNDAAYSATDDNTFAKYYMNQVAKKPTSDAWNTFRTAYREFYNQAPPESVVDLFQKKVTMDFTSNGIFGGRLKGKDGSETLVIYEPRYLKEVDEIPVQGSNQFSEGLEAQRFLDQRTHDMMPDEVNLANLESSRKAQLDYRLQQTSEALMDETVKTIDEVDAYFDVRKELINETLTNRRNVIDNLQRSTPDVATTKVGKQRAARYSHRVEVDPC